MNRVAGVALSVIVALGVGACGEDTPDSDAASTPPTAASTPDPTTPRPIPTEESTTPTPTPTEEPTATPEPEPEPAPPSLDTQDDMREFVDDLADDIEWTDSPTPKGRPRLLGVVPDTSATVELFGPPDAVDEIAYQVVFDGTDMDVNFDRALPMILLAQEYVSEDAAMFVGSQLDGFTTRPAIPQYSRSKKFGDTFVRVLGIDVVNTVNVAISTGHRPTGPN